LALGPEKRTTTKKGRQDPEGVPMVGDGKKKKDELIPLCAGGGAGRKDGCRFVNRSTEPFHFSRETELGEATQ